MFGAELKAVVEKAKVPELVSTAALHRAPHLVCDYLEQLAGAVNSWYHAGNPSRNPELAVLTDDARLREARLVLVRAIQIVLRNGLTRPYVGGGDADVTSAGDAEGREVSGRRGGH